jgi:hypothetical protein
MAHPRGEVILGAMGLFKRQKSADSPCPRCSQLVTDDQLICPMCGWDLRDAYQGPKTSEPATVGASGGHQASPDGA